MNGQTDFQRGQKLTKFKNTSKRTNPKSFKPSPPGIACVEGACEVMFAMPSLLLQPAVELVAKLSVLSVMFYGFLWVVSVGDVTSSKATIGGEEGCDNLQG
jgi:hypothetical protein